MSMSNDTSYSSLTGMKTFHSTRGVHKFIFSANPGYLGRCVRRVILGHTDGESGCQVCVDVVTKQIEIVI